MRPFRFRLATLLKMRQAVRDDRSAELLKAELAAERLAGRKEELNEELQQLTSSRRTTSVGPLVVDQLIESQRYEMILLAEEKTLTEQERIIGGEVAKRQETLMEADRKVRVLEKLSEKQKERFDRELARVYSKEMDEIAHRHTAESQHHRQSRWHEEGP